MTEKWYTGKSAIEVAELLIKNYLDVPQALIDEINEDLAQHWTDKERVCSLWRPILWYDKEKDEIRKEIQLFRTFEIRNNSLTHPFDKLCQSAYSNCFTRMIISYKDEADDYTNLQDFLVSPHFQHLLYLLIGYYPMNVWEENKFIEMLSMRPQLRELELYSMFDFKKRVEQYIKDSNLPIQVAEQH